MSGYTLNNAGAVVVGTGALSPTCTRAAGNLLLLNIIQRDNTETLTTTPSGFTLLSPQTNVGWNYLYGRIADGSATDLPTVQYSSTGKAKAAMASFSGSVYKDLNSIVHAAIDKHTPATQTSILYDALTIALGNCLVICVGSKNKTATSDGTTVNDLAGTTRLARDTQNGNDISLWWGYVQQTAATNMASATQTLTGTTETLQYTSLYIALKSASPGAVLYYNRRTTMPNG